MADIFKTARILLNLYALKRWPVSIVHFVTNRCNARCSHCFIDFDNPELLNHDLPLSDIIKLTHNLNGYLFNVNLTGGEPFLRSDLFEIAEAYFKNAHVKSVSISTNGMFTERTREFIDRFVKTKLSGKLVFFISIDNFEEFHDKNRKTPNLFKNAIQTFNLIKNYNSPNIIGNIGITVTDHNYNNVVSLYQYLRKDGINTVTANLMREEGVIKRIDSELKEKMLRAYIELTQLLYNDIFKKKIQQSDKFNLTKVFMNSTKAILYQIVRKTYLKPKYISACPAAALFCVIGANGNVYPCEIIDSPLGNLREYDMDFMKLWKSNQANKYREFIKDNNCNCIYGCALTINILSNPVFLPRIINNFIKQI